MKFWQIALISASFLACTSSSTNSTKSTNSTYGNTVDTTQAVDFNKAVIDFTQNGKSQATVIGAIGAVCQGEGCWYSFASNSDIIVDFNEKFTIPKDVSGKLAIANGSFAYDTTLVADLKKMAKEDGKSINEIDAIDKDEIKVKFTAQGLHIK